MGVFYSLLLLTMLQEIPFKEKQLRYTRVKAAYQTKEVSVKNYFSHKNLNYPGYHLFLRAFKKEGKLEVWIKPKDGSKYHLLVQYDICSSSGVLGPKRKEGDRQVPEGIYYINHFNPQSNFHLSLGLNYPNRSDKLLGDANPGSAIYIHGDCVTIGCLPMTDDVMRELYILAVEARNSGQARIPVHIFPTHLDESNFVELEANWHNDSKKIIFWQNLQTVYSDFESARILRQVHINAKGEYFF
jgi:murein L,D-transpeptidase YafK